MEKMLVFIFLILSFFKVNGQIETFYIKPNQTNSNYSINEDSSSISINSTLHLNKLFLFFGGTGSSSSKDYSALRLYATNLGYDVINLSYNNNVAAASLKNDSDVYAFDNYRQESCFGTPISDAISIDSLNSIYTRTLNLLKYLSINYSNQNWGQYLINNDSIDWSKIVVGGHSQGSGHACYLGKQFNVDRVLMFSGPNDYSNYFSDAANWLKTQGKTPIERHFAYLSLNDEIVPFNSQFTNLSALSILTLGDSILVDNKSTPYNNSHLLYTKQAPGLVILNHNETVNISSINYSVWNYILTSTIETNSLSNLKILSNPLVYPNPTSSYLKVKILNSNEQQEFQIINLTGKIIQSGKTNTNSTTIDISNLEKGIYILSFPNYYSTKFTKN